MNIRLQQLVITTRGAIEHLALSQVVTFLYGPVGTGKSTVARLIDYCFGGDLERTPAVQQEFISVELQLELGTNSCTIERAASDLSSARVTWVQRDGDVQSASVPIDAGADPIEGEQVFGLSDLLFFLCGVVPIKVRKRSRDPDSPMIRLSFRDVWWYCYLEQTHLDSSFFRLEDPFRGRKSQDAMRFFTGLHSERLSQLETELYKATDEQRGKREAANQIRIFMGRFQLGSELDVDAQVETTRRLLEEISARKTHLEAERSTSIHPTDPLREKLRAMGAELASLQQSVEETEQAIGEQRALRAELITAKIKAGRVDQAGALLSGVAYTRCPQCSANLSDRSLEPAACNLCCTPTHLTGRQPSLELEATRRELNDRIDQISDSIQRRERALARSIRQRDALKSEKREQDLILQRELSNYDSAFVESIRSVDREYATYSERIRSLEKLREMPLAISALEQQAAILQLKIDEKREAIGAEQGRLVRADENVVRIGERFKAIMLAVGFPGVSEEDEVLIDTKNWRPVILHRGYEWTFWDAGSGGKKTLFNVCYALAIHEVAIDQGMPVPNVLIIDSPTKNISDDENPALVSGLYNEIYRIAAKSDGGGIQFLLIDSNFVPPKEPTGELVIRHLAGTEDAPSLISYYSGP